ncbi:hypothetical protein ERC79_14680 [Rhodococcus sp. ABRD24]|uniref:DUF6779 domain-containing protein n=1 Tax=Rhodococcus sp. ABRD24 TaxID=2507582 RepID=UPI00103B9858|nr:DUF6779 domain-containing protein [Rhodococcus sp. ABRD24]QBJ97052.1 hypothetical protein ERC79_14680 [Rhodococcus sp. ABRD24]
MTVPGRAKSARRNRRSTSQMIVAGLLVLAVAASLFLIFSESVQLLRVGLVLALWAATLGAIAMTKYRRESALDKAKVRDLQKVYELQLEREVSARREYELGVEARVRGELGAESEDIAGLRAELAALRKHLEVLFEGRLPEDRVALRAESTRVQEIAGSYQSGASELHSRGSESSSHEQPPMPHGPAFATPYDDPVTAETSAVAPEPIDVEAVEDAPAEAEHAVEPAAAGSTTAGSTTAEADESGRVDAEPLDNEAEADLQPSRRSRRLAESTETSGAHSSGLTVAEIMANMKSESKDAGPRRRRRAE